MGLNFHEECRIRLTNIVAAAIPKMMVKNNMFLDRSSCFLYLYEANRVIPTTGKLCERLINYVDDYPITEFVEGVLSGQLLELNSFDSAAPVRALNELALFEDANAVSGELIAALETLPWRYTFTVAVPSRVSPALSEVQTLLNLSDRCRLCRVTPEYRDEYSLEPLTDGTKYRIFGATNSLLLALTADQWNPDTIYFQTTDEGYVDTYGSTAPAVRAQADVRAFFGLLLALGLIDLDRTYAPQPTKTPVFTHRWHEGRWCVDARFDLSDQTSRTISELIACEPKFTTQGDLGLAKMFAEMEAKALAGRRSKLLGQMAKLYSAGERGEKILLGAQWLFESCGSRDELLGFVQAMIVLEIVLGEKAVSDEVGLSELLRNRCAYLIAKSHKERNELIDTFREIYQVRSQIVHRGKNRLTAHERGLLHTLRKLCKRVIEREVEFLASE